MEEPRAPTAAGNLRQPTRQNIVTWVSRAWEGVTAESITKAFLRCAVSNALDGSEDDQVLEWFPEEIMVALPREGNAAQAEEESDSSLSDSDLSNSESETESEG